jgi:Uma2 family endonuclease
MPMSAKVLMDVDEYLHTSFEGPDCEYVDGVVVERNMGERKHSDVQTQLAILLGALRRQLGIHVSVELRIPISPKRYRIPDISVWRDDNLGDGPIPSIPPFLAVEILSPDDRMTRMLPKIQEYLGAGVEWVWLIDPEEKSALIFTRENRGGSVVADNLRTTNPAIEIPLAAAFGLDS